MSIQIAFDSGLIHTRQSHGGLERLGLMPRMEFLRPTGKQERTWKPVRVADSKTIPGARQAFHCAPINNYEGQ